MHKEIIEAQQDAFKSAGVIDDGDARRLAIARMRIAYMIAASIYLGLALIADAITFLARVQQAKSS